MRKLPTLRTMAATLDVEAIHLAQNGKHREARAAISLAIAFEDRQRQINESDFSPRGVVDDR